MPGGQGSVPDLVVFDLDACLWDPEMCVHLDHRRPRVERADGSGLIDQVPLGRAAGFSCRAGR
jgi:hypothetical protein